jgi:D-serine deaminase-like pyridoxal phosphate-dependent protein
VGKQTLVSIDERAVAALGDEMLGPLVKGLDDRAVGLRLRDLGTQGWNLLREDLPLPLLTLRRSSLVHNLEQMRRYCEQHDVVLAPHGKTTMAPQLFKMHFDAGCWGLTAATAEQLLVYRQFGVSRIIFANQLAGRANIGVVARALLMGQWEFMSFVDSPDAVAQLVDGSKAFGMTEAFKVFAEVGYPGGRSGVRDQKQLGSIVGAVRTSQGRVELIGVAGFEGLMPGDREPEKEANIHSYVRTLGDAVDALVGMRALPDKFLVSAGGSSAFDHVVEELGARWGDAAQVVLRSGCYITHDHHMYADSSPLRLGPEALRPALELWSYVHSRPEPRLALLTFGRRDAPFDFGFPVPIKFARAGSTQLEPLVGARIEKMNDQHGHLTLPDGVDLRVGDRVVLGISHPCTAFDKWKLLYVVDDQETIVDGVMTFF